MSQLNGGAAHLEVRCRNGRPNTTYYYKLHMAWCRSPKYYQAFLFTYILNITELGVSN